jgi:hypothetical protein
MERWIGILLIACAVWIGIEYYMEGEQAFGGLFASDSAEPAPDEPWAGERAGNKLRSAHEERGERMGRALGE